MSRDRNRRLLALARRTHETAALALEEAVACPDPARRAFYIADAAKALHFLTMLSIALPPTEQAVHDRLAAAHAQLDREARLRGDFDEGAAWLSANPDDYSERDHEGFDAVTLERELRLARTTQ
jgi:hypothetical protein